MQILSNFQLVLFKPPVFVATAAKNVQRWSFQGQAVGRGNNVIPGMQPKFTFLLLNSPATPKKYYKLVVVSNHLIISMIKWYCQKNCSSSWVIHQPMATYSMQTVCLVNAKEPGPPAQFSSSSRSRLCKNQPRQQKCVGHLQQSWDNAFCTKNI